MWNPFVKKVSSPLADDDRAVIDQMKKMGLDLSQQFVVNHYFYFPNEEAQSRAKKIIEQSGALVTGERKNEKWPVRSSHVSVLADEALLAEKIAMMTAIAQNEGGEYDGWEARPGSDPERERNKEDRVGEMEIVKELP